VSRGFSRFSGRLDRAGIPQGFRRDSAGDPLKMPRDADQERPGTRNYPGHAEFDLHAEQVVAVTRRPGRGVPACSKSSPGGFVLAGATSQAGMAAARATASKYSATVPARVSTWTIVPFSCGPVKRLERGQEHRDFGKLDPAHPPIFRVGPELRFEHGQFVDRSDSPDDQIVLNPGVISTPARSRWTHGGCRDAADLANPRSRGSGRGPACMLLHVPQHAEDVLAQDSLHFPVVEAGVEERARHLR
jgi:hypothetical protein